MSDTLAEIVAYKRERVAAARRERSLADLEAAAAAADPVRGFIAAIHRTQADGRHALIAEIKKASPSKGLIRADFVPEMLARAYADGGATCLSVLTEDRWFLGGDAYLSAARKACALPVLNKDFIVYGKVCLTCDSELVSNILVTNRIDCNDCLFDKDV
jgi:indole-3-glycerol phosphate synthase